MTPEHSKVINVIIADDHVLYRAGIKAALSFQKGIKIIAEADNGSFLLNMLKDIHPDVVLLDIQMPVMDGIVTLPQLKKLYPEIKVIMLTMMDDKNMVAKLMEMGANSFLTKTSDCEVIVEAIETCHEKNFYLSAMTNRAMNRAD